MLYAFMLPRILKVIAEENTYSNHSLSQGNIFLSKRICRQREMFAMSQNKTRPKLVNYIVSPPYNG